jgi:hypothetical protein
MLSVAILFCYNECGYAECRYAEGRGAIKNIDKIRFKMLPCRWCKLGDFLAGSWAAPAVLAAEP